MHMSPARRTQKHPPPARLPAPAPSASMSLSHIAIYRCGHTVPRDIPLGALKWTFAGWAACPYHCAAPPHPAPRPPTPAMRMFPAAPAAGPSIFPSRHGSRSVYSWARAVRDTWAQAELDAEHLDTIRDELHTPGPPRVFVATDLPKGAPKAKARKPPGAPRAVPPRAVALKCVPGPGVAALGWVEWVWRYGFYVLAAVCWLAWVSGAHKHRVLETWKVPVSPVDEVIGYLE